MPRGGARQNAGRKPKSETELGKVANSVKMEIDLDEVLPQRAGEAESILFLRKVLRSDEASMSMRMDAAKNLLPYQARRLGETGKKEEREKKAKEAGSKFAKNQPPRLVKNG